MSALDVLYLSLAALVGVIVLFILAFGAVGVHNFFRNLKYDYDYKKRLNKR